MATVELKTDNTQSIDDAVYQYKKDRNPYPKGQAAEPLLTFPSGALVHFAVSSSRVKMATKLEGFGTTFLPFDLGDNGAAGNPLNSEARNSTALLILSSASSTTSSIDSMIIRLVSRYIEQDPDHEY